MLKIIQTSRLDNVGHRYTRVNRHELHKLDWLSYQLDIPWKELNKIALMVVGRELDDCRYLSVGECDQMIEWLERNKGEMMRKYREIKYGK